MRKIAFPILFLGAALGLFAINMAAQNSPAPNGPKRAFAAQQGDPAKRKEQRPNLLRELNLSSEQMQQIRQLNQERKPLMEAAQRRLREANRGLDMAIYADEFNQEHFEARLRDFNAAQAEVARIRFSNEAAVRNILTPEQLVRFRDLRRQFAEKLRQTVDDRRLNPDKRPLRRLRGVQPPPPNQ